MKKTSFALFLLLFFLSSQAGYDLLFCSSIDNKGDCNGKSETFVWNGDNTSIQMLIKANEKIPTAKLNVKIFLMKNDREGELYADLGLNVVPNSYTAIKKLFFYKPGYYKVEIRDDKGNLLTKGFATITDRKM